jgi:hypothetical protein
MNDAGRMNDRAPYAGENEAAEEEVPLLALPTLPTGGGAIKSMGDEWSVNLLTGTAGMSIPLAASPGRGGFGPQLALTYDSASGNGPFGMGWSIGAVSVSGRTDCGLEPVIPNHLGRARLARSSRLA